MSSPFASAQSSASRCCDDDEKWWGYVYPKSLDKQETRKLFVAETVSRMSVCPDQDGQFYVDNVRANGIVPTHSDDFAYLLGVLNSAVVNWVFRRIAKPKEGGYFEANRQFTAPLPIPTASPDQNEAVSALAWQLTELHTRRAETVKKLNTVSRTVRATKRKKNGCGPMFGTRIIGRAAHLHISRQGRKPVGQRMNSIATWKNVCKRWRCSFGPELPSFPTLRTANFLCP